MRAITLLYGGSLSSEAFKPINNGGNAVKLAVEKAFQFPGTEKLIFLGLEANEYNDLPAESQKFLLVRKNSWSLKSLLEYISGLCAEKTADTYDLIYFAWADCPFLDPALASALADRHLRYTAEYSYADGWPYGFAPELLTLTTAKFLLNILGDNDGNLERDSLFAVLQKDINSFDIETEISPVDLRCHRLSFSADSKRNLLLLDRFTKAGVISAADAVELIEKDSSLLRTLPAFFNIQVAGACPQNCSLCPWPSFGQADNIPVTERSDFMALSQFEDLLDKIITFAGDAVISISLWGEVSLHPEKIKLIKAVLSRQNLSLIIESSGIGWKNEELEELASIAAAAPKRINSLLKEALSWIISLDAFSASRYKEVRGSGFAEATECAKKLLSLFPKSAYVQAVRVKDFEDDIEQFYRYWKDIEIPGSQAKNNENQVIIQKYDDFCGALKRLQASDISPLKRKPCWHNMRDMVILGDGSVLQCREDLKSLKNKDGILGNVFSNSPNSLDEIWKNGEKLYLEHIKGNYPLICPDCDEFYTYNF